MFFFECLPTNMKVYPQVVVFNRYLSAMKDDSKRLFATIQAITRRIHVCFFVCLLDMKTIRNQSFLDR